MKVLLVYDVDGWCWHHQAIGIRNHAPPGFDVTIADADQHREMVATGRLKEFDAGFYFHWPSGRKYTVSLLAHEGCMIESGSDWLSWPKAATTPTRNATAARKKLPTYQRLLCTSRRLYEWARRQDYEAHYVPAGIDHYVFRPRGWESHGGPLVVGWSGQSPDGQRTTKGWHEVMAPLMSRLAPETKEWRINRLTVHDKKLKSQQQMAEWYAGLDVFLCTSISEGGPATVFEALAAGCPVVSTDVGDVPSVLTSGENGQVVPGFCNQKTADATIREFERVLTDDRANFLSGAYRERARESILRDHTWKTQAEKWLQTICEITA